MDDANAPVLLTVAASRFECDAVAALLASCDIAVLQGPGDGLRPPIEDNSVYVRASDLDLARELLAAPVDWPE